jgi:hypothetical protein
MVTANAVQCSETQCPSLSSGSEYWSIITTVRRHSKGSTVVQTVKMMTSTSKTRPMMQNVSVADTRVRCIWAAATNKSQTLLIFASNVPNVIQNL